MPRSAAKYKKKLYQGLIIRLLFLHDRPQLLFFARFLRFKNFFNVKKFAPLFLLPYKNFSLPFFYTIDPNYPYLHDFYVSKLLKCKKFAPVQKFFAPIFCTKNPNYPFCTILTFQKYFKCKKNGDALKVWSLEKFYSS